MDGVWSWIAALPSAAETSPPLPLASSPTSGLSIFLSAATGDGFLTLSVSLHNPLTNTKILWVSEPITLSATKPQLPLLLQLLHELILLSPSPNLPHIPKLNPDQIFPALSQTTDTPSLLYLSLICRLFYLCAGDSPPEAALLLFRSFEASFACRCSLRAFLLAAGADREERLMRSIGYVVSKWCILRELQADPAQFAGGVCPAYAAEVHGLWILKGYAPVLAMHRSVGSPGFEPKDAVLRYSLAHQQLEALLQFEYSVCGRDPRFLKVAVHVDNIRLRVARLGFGGSGKEDDDVRIASAERHFPSRLRVYIGPAAGAGYAIGPSLGRSTGNLEEEVNLIRTVKGGFGFTNGGPGTGFRAKARWSRRARRRSWRWEQEAEGSAAVFEGVLCDVETGEEVAGWRMMGGGMSGRWGRAFGKGGGVVVAGDEMAEGVSWRMGRKWKEDGQVAVGGEGVAELFSERGAEQILRN
ncbi:hypothetical protein HPP92_009550 [Vanilla planifolia]|uniref:Uncharacterized protein n=1 Tax=Vanilla planifolia TaxID=51239 RepID=A0A835V728_VANPL|nr:hypothetical protein HPP92_009550 [Vanilla planifolia]